jgi:26S proteasome regulatory subunit N1
VVEPKLPEDIFKTYLERKGALANFDSARQNLASTFVNAFVNAGFGNDKLMLTDGARSADTEAATAGAGAGAGVSRSADTEAGASGAGAGAGGTSEAEAGVARTGGC